MADVLQRVATVRAKSLQYQSDLAHMYLTRDIAALLQQGGFRIEHMEAGYAAEFPKSSSYSWWGTAILQSR